MTLEIFKGNHHFGLAVGLGLITGMNRFNMTAAKINPATDTESDMVAFTDNYVFPPDAGVEMEMVSTEAGRTIEIIGLDENGMEKIEDTIVTVNGTVAIGKWSMIHGVTNGGPDSLAAVLTIKEVGAATVYAQILADDNRSFQGVHVIPADKQGYVTRLIISMQKAIGVDAAGIIRVKTIPPGQNYRIIQFGSQLQKEGNTSAEFENAFPEIIPSRTKLILTVEATAAGTEFQARIPLLYTNITPEQV